MVTSLACSGRMSFARRSHFRGGLVRKGDREDVRGIDALGDEKGHARRDHAGLARARTGQNEQRPLGRAHRAFLLRIKVEKSKAGHGTREDAPRCSWSKRALGKNFPLTTSYACAAANRRFATL